VNLSWWVSFSIWVESLQLGRLRRGLNQTYASLFPFSFVFLFFYENQDIAKFAKIKEKS
jgi:hypothetical protein